MFKNWLKNTINKSDFYADSLGSLFPNLIYVSISYKMV